MARKYTKIDREVSVSVTLIILIKTVRKKLSEDYRVIIWFIHLNRAQQLVRNIFLRAVISRFKDCDRRDTHAQQYWFRDALAVLPRFRVSRTKLWMKDYKNDNKLKFILKWNMSSYSRKNRILYITIIFLSKIFSWLFKFLCNRLLIWFNLYAQKKIIKYVLSSFFTSWNYAHVHMQVIYNYYFSFLLF